QWRRPHEEKFARAWERYFRDGVAPAPELHPVFQRLKSWFREVYRALRGSPLAGRVSPEVQAIFAKYLDADTAEGRAVRAERRADLAERAADTDPLTGLANRRALDRALPAAEADPNTHVLAFDANNFGQVNKIRSQAEGDALLKEVAGAVRRAADEVGHGARVFRRGGDEIVALIPKEHAAAVRARAEELFGERTFKGKTGSGQEQQVTVSLSGTVGSTFAEADAALQARKAVRKATPEAVPAEIPDSPAVRQALADWAAGRAYVDGAGNYRLKREPNPGAPTHQSRGPIAPWNKEAKRAFARPEDLHAAAMQAAGRDLKGSPLPQAPSGTESPKAESPKLKSPKLEHRRQVTEARLRSRLGKKEGEPLFQSGEAAHLDRPEIAEELKELIAISAVEKAGKNRWVEYRTVTPEEAARLRDAAGGDLTGYRHSVDRSAIRHILNQHGAGAELRKGQLVLTLADLQRIPEVTGSPDQVTNVSTPGQPARIRYQKRVNG
ncbi:MAG TPA: diguanylate cyclase, partial [Armatimonadota bacterium]|nr:diguanylate cyclase [Armatimonadota bacterium]